MANVQVLDRAGIGVDPSARPERAWVERVALDAIRPLGFRSKEVGEREIGWQLTVTIQLNTERSARLEDAGVAPADQVFRQASVVLELAQLKSDPTTGLRARLIGEGLSGENARANEPYSRLVESAIRSAASDAAVEQGLSTSPDTEVVAKIAAPDARIRARAVDEAGRRRLGAAVDPLIGILANDAEPPEVVFKAIGALIQIRDARAVGPLIDSARRRSPVYLGQIIFGVAQIGGKEAEAYLFTVANGHPDPEVRGYASDALKELEQARGAEAGAGAGGGRPDGG